MKLNTHTAVNEVVLSNTGATGEFRIRNSAKAFSILSDKLYSNKIKAIIRELSCNALDSHAAANKMHVPFEVHLPTALEPWFSVRDFGLGLSHDQVLNIYTTYFESTKTESNEFIGALGLGSKSPFSYTENFTVTSVYNGTRRIYSAFINNDGVPSIVDMSAELTDEENGVEVKFSVVDKYEYSSFRSNAQSVFSWFKHRPVITGVSEFEFAEPSILEKDVVPGIHLSGYRHQSYAVMGNICYPLDNIPEAEKRLGDLNNLLNEGLIIEFDIGDLDFAPSREQLSYIPSTIASIKAKLELLNASLTEVVSKKANAITNDWEKSIFLSTEYKKNIYKSAITEYVTDTKFELFSKPSYGFHTLNIKQSQLTPLGLKMRGFCPTGSGGASSIRNDYVRDSTTHAIVDTIYNITISKDTHIVLHDMNIGCYTRAQYHFSSNSYGSIFYVECEHKDKKMRDASFAKLIKLLKDPINLIYSSALRSKPAKQASASSGILCLTKSAAHRRSYYDPVKYVWSEYTEPLSPKGTYYYVTLTGFETDIDSVCDLKDLRLHMEASALTAFKNIQIFGVRKSRIDEISKKKNWIHLNTFLKDVTSKISDAEIMEYLTASYVDNYRYRMYNNTSLPVLLDTSSKYRVFYENFAVGKKNAGDISSLVKLCSLFGKTIEVSAMRTKIENEYNTIFKTYPLMRYIDSSAPVNGVAQYINSLDKTFNSVSNTTNS